MTQGATAPGRVNAGARKRGMVNNQVGNLPNAATSEGKDGAR